MRYNWGTDRLAAFSDGVFAIAITLLILEIDVPDSSFDNLWKGILDQWPSYLAYVTSFLTIGATWLHHHLVFRQIAWANSALLRLNILLLMLVSFLPFPTKLMAKALTQTDTAERVAVFFYGVVLLTISATMALIWHQAVANDQLKPEVTATEITTINRLTRPFVALNVLVISSAFVVPKAAVFGYLLIAAMALLRRHHPQQSRADPH